MQGLDQKIIVITGGTGSFGTAVLDKLIEYNVKEIRILSRDEKKQDDMRSVYNNDKLKFFIGDVRDIKSLTRPFRGADYVFHAAALKQVPSCEFFPLEAVKTNIIGTENVIDAAVEERIKKVVCLSTDKAVYPINSMGLSKALMEKVLVAKSREAIGTGTVICGTRYGNVLSSRGSVVPRFIEQINNGSPLTITNGSMTRFIMTLEQAVSLVLHAFLNGNQGEIFVQKAPSVTIDVLAEAVCHFMGVMNYPIKNIGMRHGEKLYETLIGSEEFVRSQEEENYFRILPDKRNLNYEQYTNIGNFELTQSAQDLGYNSNNVEKLSVHEMCKILKECI